MQPETPGVILCSLGFLAFAVAAVAHETPDPHIHETGIELRIQPTPGADTICRVTVGKVPSSDGIPRELLWLCGRGFAEVDGWRSVASDVGCVQVDWPLEYQLDTDARDGVLGNDWRRFLDIFGSGEWSEAPTMLLEPLDIPEPPER